MNIRPRVGETRISQTRASSNSGPFRKSFILPRGCLCPRPTTRGLGTAKEQPSYAMCEPSRSHLRRRRRP
jgi:hypothetical protein